jgi:hypothetical protein
MLLDVLNQTDDALVSDRSYKIENQAPFADIRSKLIRRRECECDEGHT